MSAMEVTSGFFDVVGVGPVRGRTFTEEEARSGACFAVLSEDASGAAEAIGSTIELDNVPCEVIGVMPKALASVSAGLNPQGGGVRADRITVWTPLSVAQGLLSNRGAHLVLGVARLRQGASAALADAQMRTLRDAWSATYPEHYARGHFAVSRPLQDDIVGNHRDAWVLLGGAATFVLLIVCVNIAALLVSNGEARRREFAVRRNRREPLAPDPATGRRGDAPGGGRRCRRGRAGEVAARRSPLAVSAAAAGVACDLAIDGTAVLSTCALLLLVGMAVGLIPARCCRRPARGSTMRSRRTPGPPARLAAPWPPVRCFVVAQLAVSVMLLAGALLLIRAYERLQHVDLGLQPDGVLTFEIVIPRAHQEDAAAKPRWRRSRIALPRSLGWSAWEGPGRFRSPRLVRTGRSTSTDGLQRRMAGRAGTRATSS